MLITFIIMTDTKLNNIICSCGDYIYKLIEIDETSFKIDQFTRDFTLINTIYELSFTRKVLLYMFVHNNLLYLVMDNVLLEYNNELNEWINVGFKYISVKKGLKIPEHDNFIFFKCDKIKCIVDMKSQIIAVMKMSKKKKKN